MEKIYKDTPDNFSAIEPYVITKKEDIVSSIIQARRCYFYDTCAFRNHMGVPNPEFLFDYIKQTAGVVVIIRCIIMELCSNDGKLWSEHIEYVKKMNQYGIKILIMYEEDVFQILSTCYSGIAKINTMLSIAVKCVKSKTGTIERTLESNPALQKELLIEDSNKDSTLAERLFQEVRNNKISKDNLGEELIAVCVHMLTNIREVEPFKYVIFTDDNGAITLLSKAMQNLEKHIGMKCISAATTPKLCWLMKEKAIISTEMQVIDILEVCYADGIMKVFCSEMFELGPNQKSMQVAEFAKKLIHESIRVYC